jgi:hypothetical protein
MRHGDTLPESPQNRRENKTQQAISETVVFISDHRPTKQLVYGIHIGGGVSEIIVLCFFSHFRLNWSELTKITPNCCRGQADCRSSTKLSTTPQKTCA